MLGLDKDSTYVLLIGEGNYPNWPQMNIPNVHVNIEQLAALLSDPYYCGIPAEKIKIVKDEDVEDTSSAIYEFFDAIPTANATVILYYSGHGLQSVKAMDDLFLATKNIRENKFEPSAIKISELRKLFSDCIASRKILLLDCCYAGKITKGFLSDDASDTVAKLNEFEGTYIMAASSEYERARFDPNDPNSPTKFTGKFIEVIKNGIDTDDEYCTLNSIYNQIRSSFLTQKDAPKPVQVEQNNIANFPIFKNKKFTERIPEDEKAWQDAIKKNNAVTFYKFKEQYPNSTHVKDADIKINEIEDEDAWQKARVRDTIGGYNFYLENYHSGAHVQDAKKSLAKLTVIEQFDNEEKNAWAQAEEGNTIDLYRSYAEKYPKGKYTEEALLRINAFEEHQRDERFWNDVSERNNIASYQEYLKIYPDGNYCSEAKNKIKELQQEQKPPEKKDIIKKQTSSSSGILKIVLISVIGLIILIVLISQVIKSTRSAYKNNVKNPDTLVNPADLFGDSNQSRQVLPQNTTSSTGDYIYYWNLGIDAYNKSNYQDALSAYNKAIELNNTTGDLYYNRGLCYSKIQNYNLAIDDLTTAIKLNPNDGNAYNERGNDYNYLKRMDEACENYKTSADLGSSSGKANYDQYCADFSEASAALISVDQITADIKYDVLNNRQKGINIFPQFTIKNAAGKSGTINAYFYYRDHKTALKDYNKNYYATDGNVSAWRDIIPSYSLTTYNTGNNDFSIFMPYDELDLPKETGKQYLLSLYLSVFINGQLIKSSGWYDFYVTY